MVLRIDTAAAAAAATDDCMCAAAVAAIRAFPKYIPSTCLIHTLFVIWQIDFSAGTSTFQYVGMVKKWKTGRSAMSFDAPTTT